MNDNSFIILKTLTTCPQRGYQKSTRHPLVVTTDNWLSLDISLASVSPRTIQLLDRIRGFRSRPVCAGSGHAHLTSAPSWECFLLLALLAIRVSKFNSTERLRSDAS